MNLNHVKMKGDILPALMLAAMVAAPSQLRADINDGIVVHYTLDDAAGTTAADASGNGNDGTLVDFAGGGGQWVAGNDGNALELGGGYVAVDSLPAMESTTWAAWVRLTAESPFGAAISATFPGAGAGHSLGFHSGETVLNPRVLWNHNAETLSLISPDPVEVGTWNHLALTYNSGDGSLILYVNGEQKIAGTVSTTAFSSINLGRRESSGDAILNGALDDVAVFERALTADEIALLFSGQQVVDGLVLRWDMNETDGFVAADSSGNGYDGTLMDFPPAEVEDWTTGRIGGALDFSKNAHVEVSGLEEMVDTTWSVWVKLNSQPSYGAAISATFDGAAAGHSLGFHTDATAFNPRVLWNHNAGFVSIVSPDPVAVDEWNHLLMTYDSTAGEAALFVNGEEKGREAVGTSPFSSLNLGRREASANTYLDAVLDEVRIYNRVLDIDDILELAAAGAPEGPAEILVPPAALTVHENGTARFEVEADGALPLRYLWFKGEEPLRDQTGPELVIEHLTPADAGEYSVRVSNDAAEVVSDPVSLTVLPVDGLETARQAFWTLDESSGTTASDSSGNSNDGSLINFADDSSHWVDGQVDGAISFDGFGSHIEVDSSESLSALGDEASFAFWIRLNSYGPEEDAGTYTRSASFLLSRGSHFHIKMVNDPGSVSRTILVRSADGAASSLVQKTGEEVNAPQGSLTLDEWQHWTIVYRNRHITFYRNGFRVGEPVEGILGGVSDTPLLIGDFDSLSAGLRSIDGTVDQLGIWGRPLAEEEILELAGLDISGAPAFSSQPGSRRRLEGSSTTFEVFVTGRRPVTYQWFKDGDPVEGAVSSSYTIDSISPDDAGTYTVTVTNDEGSSTSDDAVLEVEALGDVTSGLVAYFPFDEDDGNELIDASGNEVHGDLQNFDDGFRISGVVGGAYDLDGIDDLIIIPHNDILNLTDQATVSVWLNPESVSNNGDFDRVIRKDVNFDFVLLNGGIARVHGFNKNPYSSPGETVANGVWQHFAYTFKDGVVQWFKNGEPVGNPIPGSLGEVNSNPLVIGNFQPDTALARFYEGAIDELGIWQRALSATAIAGIYENGLRGNPLNVEFEPLNIRSVISEAGQVSILFYTPYEGRDHVVNVRSDINADAWLPLDGVDLNNIEPGLFRASFEAPEGDVGFYRISALTPPPLFTADFEDGTLDGWTTGGSPADIWEAGEPVIGPPSAFEGSNVLATDLDDNFPEFTDATIRTPTIDLSGVTSATLTLSEWFSVDESVDFHQLIINAVTPGAAEGEVLVELSRMAGITDAWTTRSIRLAGDAVGQPVQLEFRIVTDDFSLRPGWYIDSISVTAD